MKFVATGLAMVTSWRVSHMIIFHAMTCILPVHAMITISSCSALGCNLATVDGPTALCVTELVMEMHMPDLLNSYQPIRNSLKFNP